MRCAGERGAEREEGGGGGATAGVPGGGGGGNPTTKCIILNNSAFFCIICLHNCNLAFFYARSLIRDRERAAKAVLYAKICITACYKGRVTQNKLCRIMQKLCSCINIMHLHNSHLGEFTQITHLQRSEEPRFDAAGGCEDDAVIGSTTRGLIPSTFASPSGTSEIWRRRSFQKTAVQ